MECARQARIWKIGTQIIPAFEINDEIIIDFDKIKLEIFIIIENGCNFKLGIADRSYVQKGRFDKPAFFHLFGLVLIV